MTLVSAIDTAAVKSHDRAFYRTGAARPFLRREEASQLGSIRIDTEHLLLGLIRDRKGLTNRLFADAGIALDDIRHQVLRRVPARSKTSTSQEMPFSAAAQCVLQHSEEEADRLLHDYLGTEHLLLGLLSEKGSVAADVLTARGLRLDTVREHIVKLLSDGERPEHPGPPSIPANTFKWPWLRFVPSRSVHILYSELKPPQQPVTNYSGPGLQAYGYTLTEAIVDAWRGNRWHIDIIDGLDDGTRYDFYIQFAQTEPGETFQQMWRDSIERQFELSVTRETRPRDVWVARSTGHVGPMLRYYGEAESGSGFAMANLNLVMGRPHDAPLFPLEAFAVHSVPFFYLTRWFEEFLGGQVIDETSLRGTLWLRAHPHRAQSRRADPVATRPGRHVDHARTARHADAGSTPLRAAHTPIRARGNVNAKAASLAYVRA